MKKIEGLMVIPTDTAPEHARLVDDFTPSLIDVGAHNLCPGCGEPIAMRSLLEIIEELAVIDRCEVLQALHGRAPSLATGVKRAKPNTLVFTIQGDGDMVNEGLQEVIHAAARGENITCVMLNNGVFGETGGHITAATVMGQRTKNSLEGRNAKDHGYPIRLSNLIAELEGAVYVARGAVNTAGNVAKTRRMITRAFETQLRGEGFSFLEILTMCPTGWFIETQEAPDYLDDTLAATHTIGVVKDTASK
ncbi:MAG: hypothetical protein E6G39_08150 [Actinobacteria bacterium]|nr:MAG: hypothetical protein E6G39_08150 [Actinomycetota bacterium]